MIDSYICTASLDQTIKIWNFDLEQVPLNVVHSIVPSYACLVILVEFDT